MNKNNKLIFLLFPLLLASSFNTQSAIAQERKTIRDYFLNLPATYIRITPGGSQIDRTERVEILKRGGTIVDINNGYLRTASDTCLHELAIFKRTKGSPLVAINTSCTVGGSIAIVDPDRNWKDVTTQVFPMQTLKTNNEMGVTIKLPRQGRIITIGDDDRNVRWQLVFKNNRFQAMKKI
jgi:hypothetical protein